MHATWHGPAARPLFGWWHLPADGHASAGVLIVPPLGWEHSIVLPALRLLADRLAGAGCAVLRTHLDGLGDSAGSQDDPGRFDAWRASIRSAMQEVRRTVGGPLIVVGMRSGALLSFVVAEQGERPYGLALWDPPATGRAMLREQRARHRVGLGEGQPDSDRFECLGFDLDENDVAQLEAVDLRVPGVSPAERVLVLERPGARTGRLAKRLPGEHVTWGQAMGQDDLLVLDALGARMPVETIESIVSWVVTVIPSSRHLVQPDLRSEAVVGWTRAGLRITETAVALGPLGLAGIVTTVPGAVGPTAMLIGNESRVGPGGLWVDIARSYAEIGRASVRFDLSGLGDSPVREGQVPFRQMAPEAFDDVRNVAEEVSPGDPTNVVLTGLCASAYVAVNAAVNIRPRGVGLFNLPSLLPTDLVEGDGPELAARASRARVGLQWLSDQKWAQQVAMRLPRSAWSFADRIRRYQSPSSAIEEVARNGAAVMLLSSSPEAAHRYRRIVRRSAGFVRPVEMVTDDGLDHGMLRTEPRRRAVEAYVGLMARLPAKGAAQPAAGRSRGSDRAAVAQRS